MKKHILGYFALVMLAACSGTKTENAEKEGVETILPKQVNEVTVMTLAKGNFNHELVSNGKSWQRNMPTSTSVLRKWWQRYM